MENTVSIIRNKLQQLQINGPVKPVQLQQLMASLPLLPRLGAPPHADDRYDHLAAYYALGPRHRDELQLQPVRVNNQSIPLHTGTLATENLNKANTIDFIADKLLQNLQPVAAGAVALADIKPGKVFDPILRVRLQAIFCRNNDGKLTDGHPGQTKEVLSAALLKVVSAVNAVFKPQTGIEFIFYPAADLEIANDTRLNQDFVIPTSEAGQLTQKNALTAEQMQALADKNTSTPYRNQYAAKYPTKMVLLFAEGTRFFKSGNNWVLSSPSGGGFSWEDLDFVKLGAELGTTDADAHGWVHGFQAHEMGHFLHLHHTFVESERLFLSEEEYNNPNTTPSQKLALARKKAIDFIEKHRKEAPGGSLALLLDGDRDTVTDTPPDEGTHILTFENMLQGTGNVCGTDGNIAFSLNDGTKINYNPDRTLAMSYYKGCFDNTFSPGQAERMRNALISKNRRRLVKTQLGDTAYPGEYVCACWDPNPNGQVYNWGMSLDTLKAEVEKWKSQGLFLTWQQAYTKKGTTLYDAIFNPGKAAPRIIWGWTVEDFKNENVKQQGAGSGLTHAESYLLPDGQIRMNAIWYAGAPLGQWVAGYTQDDFGKVFFDKAKANQRLIHINSWNLPNNGGVRYDGIWVPGTYGQFAFADMSATSFQQKYGEMWQQKFKLVVVDAVRVGNELKYTGVWNPNPNGQYLVWGKTREQVREAYDEMWNQGMKLRWMSTVLF